MDIKLPSYQARVESALDKSLSNAEIPERLRAAMRYSTLQGGKRIRAMLAYAAGEALGAPLQKLDSVAAALECIHAYSLIHDDLPAMDDDDLRRGQASSHIKFDQATAILAGDALQAMAFEIINSSDSELSDQQCRLINQILSASAGALGMVGGQMLDILATEQSLDQSQLENVHRRKTGALIHAAVISGAYCSDNVDQTAIAALETYSRNIGLAFQVIDDVLDIESSSEQLGKTSGSDLALGKSTYPALLGLEESKKLAEKLYQQAVASLDAIGDNAQLLIDLADLVVRRQY